MKNLRISMESFMPLTVRLVNNIAGAYNQVFLNVGCYGWQSTDSV